MRSKLSARLFYDSPQDSFDHAFDCHLAMGSESSVSA
jgi:hypothetical protein